MQIYMYERVCQTDFELGGVTKKCTRPALGSKKPRSGKIINYPLHQLSLNLDTGTGSTRVSQSQIHGQNRRQLPAKTPLKRRFDCDFHFDSHEWSCSYARKSETRSSWSTHQPVMRNNGIPRQYLVHAYPRSALFAICTAQNYQPNV